METKDLNPKYLSDLQLSKFFTDFDYSSFELMSQDSINETAILKRILDSPKKDHILPAAINLAVVGFGRQNYGSFKYQGTIIDIKALILSIGGLVDLKPGHSLKEDDITASRLCRVLRSQIRHYIQMTGFQTYLLRKYSNDESHYDICFRGAEYLDLNPDERAKLLEVYKAVDLKQGSNIEDKIRRVFDAKDGLILKTIKPVKP